jgi:hypothetical protein
MARIVELILTDELRGKGEPDFPYRRVTQLFFKDGTLCCEWDPAPPAGWQGPENPNFDPGCHEN